MFVGTVSSFGIKMSDIPQKRGLLEGYLSYKWSSFCIPSLEHYKTKKTEERNSADEKQNWGKDCAQFIYTSSCIALTINNTMKMTEFLISLTIHLISGFKL